MPAAGQKIKALDFSEAVTAGDTTTQTGVPSTASAGSPEVGVTFVAPTSGKVAITVGGSMADPTNNSTSVIDSEVYLGSNASGTLISATGSQLRRVIVRNASVNASVETCRTYLLTGLTPGETYYARTMHFGVGVTTVNVLGRTIMVVPLPA